MLEQNLVQHFRRAIILCSDDVHPAKTKLIVDGFVDVDVKIKSNRHRPST
jgi:hypothetical protein